MLSQSGPRVGIRTMSHSFSYINIYFIFDIVQYFTIRPAIHKGDGNIILTSNIIRFLLFLLNIFISKPEMLNNIMYILNNSNENKVYEKI